jgi:hypothetical protein
MKHKLIAVAFVAGCFAAVPAAFAFEIVTDNSGLTAGRFFAEDPDGADGSTPVGNQFANSSLGPYEYHVPEDAFPEGFSYSGYGFEDEALARHDDEQAKTEATSEAKRDAETLKKATAQN